MKYPFHNPDLLVVYVCLSLLIFTIIIKSGILILEKRCKKRKLLEIGTSRIYIENIETRAAYIKKKIESCWEEDKLNEYLGHIAQFKKDYHYDYNSKYVANKLIDAYEQQKTNIYREQIRAEVIIREMERLN